MKKVWIALILLLVIGAIVGILVYLNKEKPLEENRTHYSYENNAVEEIRIVSGDAEVLFVKNQGVWTMVKPGKYTIDPDAVSRLENRLKDFLASRVLEEDTQDLQRYGLDKPRAIITFKLDDGTENTLFIGEMTASRVQYYAKDSMREQVYILGSYDVENFLSPVSEFRDRTLLSVDAGSINRVGLAREDIPDFMLIGDDSGAWNISEPLEGKARGDAVEEMIGDILEMKIKDFIDENPDDPSQYGLDKPAYTLELGDKKQSMQTIYFGKIDEDKQITYIKTGESDEVYTLSLEAFDPRRFKISNFLDETPLSVAIGEINKVTIIEGDSVVEFERDASKKEEDAFTYLGNPVNTGNFTTLYVNIMALTAEGYDPNNKGGAAELTVILELVDNRVIKEEFVKRDDLSYYMILDGEPRPFYIGERKVELIRWWRDRVLEGL